jgi:hypothetical protein
MSSLIVAAFLTSSAFAVNEQHIEVESRNKPRYALDCRFDFGNTVYIPESNFVDMVTMTRIPAGSLWRDYKGPTRLVLKAARSHVRKFARKYHEHSEHPERLVLNIRGGPTADWWDREWYDSLPSDKGGAPDKPYIHTYGKEIEWQFGPITISNTLKVRFDYIGAFNLDTDAQPVAEKHDPDKLPKGGRMVLDLRPDKEFSYGTTVKFKVRPSIRVGLPRKGWVDILRKVSVRACMSLFIRGKQFIDAEAELTYKPRRGLMLTFGVAVNIW